MLFVLWRGAPHRVTRDLDLLSFGDPDPRAVTATLRDVCTVVVEDDGLVFPPASVQAREIKPGDRYRGVRVTLRAMLGTARLDLRVDVGFGDAVAPAPVRATFPSILGQSPALLRVYPREAVMAEKVEAILSRGLLNSRLKDYFDPLFLAERFSFEGEALLASVRATLTRRATPLPEGVPEGLSRSYATDRTKQSMWAAFLRKSGITSETRGLPEVIDSVSRFVLPVLDAAGARSAGRDPPPVVRHDDPSNHGAESDLARVHSPSQRAHPRAEIRMAKRQMRRKKSFPETPTCNCVLLCDDVVSSAKGKRRAERRGESLAAINRRISANWPAIIEAAKRNTKRLTGRESL
jgi:hypothetical protein